MRHVSFEPRLSFYNIRTNRVDIQPALAPKRSMVNVASEEAASAPVKRMSDGPAEDYSKFNKKSAVDKVGWG
jgi:hypothetical protein